MNIPQQGNAAYHLEGRVLKEEWKVTKRLEPSENSTGGFFSVCYTVENILDSRKAFLKAINFVAFFQMFPKKSIIDILSEQTNAYKFEKQLLQRCKSHNLTKVSLILDEGEEYVNNCTIPQVPYLIFEMADGDIRKTINFSKNIDAIWKLRSLHHVAVGIQQLHNLSIGHQDLKPSNILIFEGITSKIGDLGRSLCKDIESPHENGGNFPGDFTYAPPEFLYNYIEPDWNRRIKATDLYLFGSLIVFYFTGTNMTSLIGKNLDSQFLWTRWRGDFNDVKDYLVNAFYISLREFQDSLNNKALAEELVKVVDLCCFPYPEKRGHPKLFSINSNQFDFQRIISKFDLLAKKMEYKLL